MSIRKPEDTSSLNDSTLGELSIEELKGRLQIEAVDVRGEMWTGCGCADYTSCRCVTERVEPSCSDYVPSGICPVDGMKV